MNKIKQEEKETKEAYKLFLAEFIAKTVEIKYRLYKKSTVENYEHIFNSCLDTFPLSNVEKQQIYDNVDSILIEKYHLLVANEAFNEEVIHLVSLKEEGE